MSYSFNPLSDEELDSFDLAKKGVYDFEIVKSNRKVSKNGNPMAELNLKIWDELGKEHFVFDYLVFSNINLCIRKVSRFCKSTGLYEEYKKGQIPEELEGLTGKLELGIQDESPNPNGGVYPKKNIVLDYLENNTKKLMDNKDEFIDDSLPF